jgi:hypothetical protein
VANSIVQIATSVYRTLGRFSAPILTAWLKLH